MAVQSVPNEKSLRKPASPSSRVTFVRWLRKVHGWIGLWGAVMGFLLGVTGILQNHRSMMKISIAAPSVSSLSVAVPDPVPATPKDLASFLETTLKLDRPARRALSEPSRQVTWNGQSVTQPEQWQIHFQAPHYVVDAQYVKGANVVTVTHKDQGLLATLENMHKGEGVNAGWILFADSIAGAFIVLSITGVLLWTELNRRKVIGASIFGVALITAIVLGTLTI